MHYWIREMVDQGIAADHIPIRIPLDQPSPLNRFPVAHHGICGIGPASPPPGGARGIVMESGVKWAEDPVNHC